MKYFFKKLFLYLIPVYIFLLVYLFTDPFKIIYSYDNYYEKNDFVSLNRTVINAKTYLKNRKTQKYNAFIFGSSRSIAAHCKDWRKHLPNDARPFHYDGNAEGLYGINKKVKFIDSQGDTIKYAVVFIDQMLLENLEAKDGFLYVEYPSVSGKGWLNYHLLFLKAFTNPKFFLGYYYIKYTGKYKPFMGSKILNLKYPNVSDPITSDLFLGFETDIKNDSIAYFEKLQFMSDLKNTIKPVVLTPTEKEIKMLLEIKAIFDKHRTDYRIVSNPFISQFPLCSEQKELLESVFGKDKVFDFSGKSRFSNDIHNFYDPSHFRSHVANEIFIEIYKN